MGAGRNDRHRSIIGALCLAVTIGGVWLSAAPAVNLDPLFKRFWDARNPQEAARAGAELVRAKAPFDAVFSRLKQGRMYSANVPRGVVHLSRRSGGVQYFYDVDVPRDYNPTRRYQVRVQLHGGVGREASDPRGDGSIGELAGDEQIYIQPYAWRDAPWWTNVQLENLRAILDSVKRTYNVDENHVALAGVSDGGTATYYFAMRDTTSYSSFLALNGFFLVLSNPLTGAEGALFPNNFLNKPIFVVNGGEDAKYPAVIVEPFVEHLQAAGVEMEYRPQPTAGHYTAWWPEVKDHFESFVRDHPRNPLPAKLTWESVVDPLANRAHWLVIDKLNSSRDGARLPDIGDIVLGDDLQPASPKLFLQTTHFGRVDLVRTGNTVQATTRGTSEFTLLISPDAFDLAQPIKVVANGREVFNAPVQPSVATLVKWAARDNDRTMLFAAELHITLE